MVRAVVSDVAKHEGRGQIMLGLLSHAKEFVLHLTSNRNLLYGFKQSNKIIRFVLENDPSGLLSGT